MKKIILFVLLATFTFASSTFSDPQPTFEKPRRVVFQLFDSDVSKVNHNLSSIYNILKEYPSETLKIVVVTYGNGMRALRKDYDKATLNRITSLMEYDVEFIGCINTMETMKWNEDEFIDDVSYVQAGIVELIERKVAGYVGIIAY
ncbi:DsrE family protein [Arcobacter sp.]|uniref:DsrE family protein n=1 Tax=Arcobacter sp. TaxID=1872629 RepID=UPI003D134B51